MSDFIFSSKAKHTGLLKTNLQSIYKDEIEVTEHHWEFGSLAIVKNHYNGFESVSTTDHMLVVIGGPLLKFRENDFITKKNSNEGSRAIYERWILEDNMKWDDDLSGPFTIICVDFKKTRITVVTDLMSFIPVYAYQGEKSMALGSHPDVMARLFNCKMDEVSMADFVLHEVVTYPYTLYEGLKQLPPASISDYNEGGNLNTYENLSYWEPRESQHEKFSIDELSNELRDSFLESLNQITEYKPKTAMFLSGGEDSRAIASGLPEGSEKNAFIFINEENLETQIARKVADAHGIKLNVAQRKDEAYYWEIFEPASDLVGGAADFAHVHTYGFHKTCDFRKYDVIIGGFLADTLLKGHHIRKKKYPKSLRFMPLPDKVDKSRSRLTRPSHKKIDERTLQKVHERRQEHLKWIKKIRPQSAGEWFNLWPISMHNDMPNVYGNRRLFRSFEPFTSSGIVKVASKASQYQKLNRRLYHKAMKPLYKRTWFVSHSNGFFPYLGWFINKPLRFANRLFQKIAWKISNSAAEEPSWGDWSKIIRLPKAKELAAKYVPALANYFKTAEVSEKTWSENTDFSERQKRMLLQLAYVFSKFH